MSAPGPRWPQSDAFSRCGGPSGPVLRAGAPFNPLPIAVTLERDTERKLEMAHGQRTTPNGWLIGPGAGIGAGIGLLFGLLSGLDLAVGLVLGAAVGLLVGLAVDALEDDRHDDELHHPLMRP